MQFSEIPSVRCSKQGDISGSIRAWNVSSANQSARISIVTETINMRYWSSVRSKWLDNDSHCCSISFFFFPLLKHFLCSFTAFAVISLKLFINADSSPRTAPRPPQSAPTSSHMDHMWISVTGACSNRIPPEVAAKQVHIIWTKIVTLERPR